MPYSTTVTDKLHSIAAQQWNALDDSGNPFLRHEFLDALEQNDCLGPRWGWLPQHILVHDDNKRLVGAMPMYIKDNSYGELVFDWAWAQAYQQHGLAYYPKLVAAIPYTPVTGPRLLCAAGNEQDTIKSGIARAALDHARQLDVSSLHILFPDEHDTRI
ncbi:MAG: peptidogalycan biosysnthesis protein, partial [Granulosicoccaceae bacterium]